MGENAALADHHPVLRHKRGEALAHVQRGPESLEVAVYEALFAAANSVGDNETAALARQIQAEETAMAKQLFIRIADSSVLAVAAAG